MKKALIIATISSMIDLFEMPNISLLKSLGYRVYVECNFKEGNVTSPERVQEFQEELKGNGTTYHHVGFSRSPLSKDNFSAYCQLKKLLKDTKFDIIHCHTPVAAILTRLAARKYRKSGTKVIYTAHGFHFFKGAPKLNWLIYYPLERLCSRFTDVLITINKEDYEIAKTRMHAKQVRYIPGVGIDTKRFADTKVDVAAKRKELGVSEDAVMLLSVGELIKRKNHEIVIKALSKMNTDLPLHYCIVGQGPLDSYLQELVKDLKLQEKVHFTGYRHDIPEICKTADVFVFPSLQEGLPVALMEAMAAGLPCVASDIRGNVDLIDDKKGGCLVSPKDEYEFANAIQKIYNDRKLCKKFGDYNRAESEKFDIQNVAKVMKRIYTEQGHQSNRQGG